MSGQEQWYMAFDRKSGMSYYYNNRGDTTYQRPPGYTSGGSAPNKRPSMLGMGGGQNVRMRPQTGGSSGSGGQQQQMPAGGGGGGGYARKVTPSTRAPASLGVNQKMGTPLRALYAHVARYEDELTLRPGQIVIGLERVEGGTWWYGELNGMRGHFPANFVEVVEQNRQGNVNMNQNYGASSPGWFQQQASPQRPPKPDAIAANNTPRNAQAQLQDQKRVDPNRGKAKLKFTFWAHTWGYAFAMYAIVLGGFAFFWYMEAQKVGLTDRKRLMLGTPFVWTGPAVAGTGLIAFFFEYQYGLNRSDTGYAMWGNLPYRGIMYFILSAPSFTSYCTILGGIIGLIAAGVNYFSETFEERGKSDGKNFIFRCKYEIFMGWGFTQSAIVLGFLAINAGLFIYRYIVVENDRQLCITPGDPRPVELCPTMFAPFAKGFGTSLDFTCSFIVVPVLRAFIKRISTIEVAGNKTLATVIPLKKNIQGHKIIAFGIFLGSVGHIVFHFLNFGINPVAAVAGFGVPALYTGGAITLFMTIIFTAAHDSVRRSSFEAFWWSHHFFLLCFPFLLAHGPKYWYFAVLPIPLYALDRLVRARRGTNTMMVDYVRFAPPVLKLHFFPERLEDFIFREGQYLYIQCPHINDYEWHPFTISSSFGDLEKDGYVSLHIRVQAPGSWTHQMKEYFKLLAGKGGGGKPGGDKKSEAFEAYLTHFDSSGVVQRGKHFGPDGKPLVRIDGPHAAPAQTYSIYREVMLVGSGIGLTPSAAILSAVTRHKWKKGFQPETLRFFWVVRHSEIDSFEWFIELLDDVSRKVVADRKAGAITPYHRLEINIYVTSAPSTTQVVQQVEAKAAAKNKVEEKRRGNNKEAGMLDTYLGFTMSDIKTLIKNPNVSSKEQAQTQYSQWGQYNKLINRLGYIYVWNGRPQWPQIFDSVRQLRQRNVNEIGIVYCGAPAVGNDLKTNSARFTGPECKFTLNKEVF